jgi:hypothetical protein
MSFGIYALTLKNIERQRRNERRLQSIANLGLSRDRRVILPNYEQLEARIESKCTVEFLEVLFEEANSTEEIDEDYKINVNFIYSI